MAQFRLVVFEKSAKD